MPGVNRPHSVHGWNILASKMRTSFQNEIKALSKQRPREPCSGNANSLKKPEDSTWTLKSRWPWTHMPSRQRGAGAAAAQVSVPDGHPDKDASQAPVTALLVAGRLLQCPVSIRRGERKSGREAGSVSQRSAESFLLPGCWAPSALR